MRTATITLAGEERLLCFSTRVTLAITQRYGSLEAMFDAIQDKNEPSKAMEVSLWVLEQMMDAGARYADHEGIDHAPPLTADEILDLSDPMEIIKMSEAIQATMTAGTGREVEAKPPKNAKAGAGRPRPRSGQRGGSGTASTSASRTTKP